MDMSENMTEHDRASATDAAAPENNATIYTDMYFSRVVAGVRSLTDIRSDSIAVTGIMAMTIIIVWVKPALPDMSPAFSSVENSTMNTEMTRMTFSFFHTPPPNISPACRRLKSRVLLKLNEFILRLLLLRR